MTIDERFCKGCHLCVDQCPQNVYQVSSKRNQKGYLVPTPTGAERCKACLLCEMICPDMVITVEKLKDEK
ncbi:MAG: ferredoxin family protein [Deltaproteobacteria bacterium]|nr:ferredoxin family protein [Deltaproteobacteria bacterium]MBW1961587.1 ferredoxin family protein [Deltaproteobacteria bacterium]MBW2152082.1 ferredoxin family protein [Deltaproteobacteria bacterium]